MLKFSVSHLKFLLLFLLVSCQTVYQPKSVEYKDYRLSPSYKSDENVVAFLKPYSDSVNKSMNDVVAVSEIDLEKKQPEGTLGNLVVDAMLAMAKEKYKTGVDAAFVNFGGIRLPVLPAGNITRGKVFELSPFDNIIVLLKINGKTLQEFLDHLSTRKGWPTAGASWQIKDKAAVNVTINGKPIDANATYTIATLDYVANGGDDCAMLRPIPQVNNGYIFRDAILEYLTSFTKQGKKVSSKIENRVTNVQ